MKRSWFVFALPIILCCVPAGASTEGGAGIEVDLEPWTSNLGTVISTIRWEAPGDEASISLKAPEGVSAVIEGGEFLDSGDRRVLGAVVAGQSLQVEIFGLEEGQEAFLAVDRMVGGETFQLMTTIGFSEGRPAVLDAQPYRIFEKEAEPRGDISERPDGGDHGVAFHPSGRTFVIESLQPKTAAVVFGEDPTDVDIPISAPEDCEQATHRFSTTRTININAAPAGSVTTALSIHIIMSHWDASQMHIGYVEDDYYWAHYPWGALLWYEEDSQVDLDEVWTRDKYNNQLPGIGYDPNGWFQLWFVDCTGGAVGTLEYWSVEATYDTSADVDLVADNVSVSPATAAPGDDIEVVWDGHIAGTGSIAGGFTTRIYLSSDTTITTGDTVLATINEAAASDPGDTFGDDAPGRTVTLPGGLSDGAWYVGIIVDYNDAVDESNENNNTAWDGITIDSGSSVDLVADSITPQAGSVAAGSSVNVNWFGHADAGNSGDISGNFTVGFYLSNDATVTTGDTLLDRATVVGPTSPGESFGANGRSLLIPGGTTAGTRYLGIIVDDTGSVAETNENNNAVTSAITVTGGGGGQPDLVPGSCSVSPSSIQAGDLITVTWTERNQGTGDAPAFWTGVHRSANTTFEPGSDPQMGQRHPGPLAAGAQEQVIFTTTNTAGLADGTYYLLVISDINDEVTESNESNNVCYSTLVVGSGGGPGTSDRWLIPAAASAPGYSGSDWRTQIAITNSSNQTREATVYYVSDTASWPGTLLTGPVSIGARRSHYIDDVLRNLRPTAGLLYVVMDAPGPVVTTRTYNLASDGSTFGQGIPGIPLLGGAAPDELILPMVHSGAGRFHTNLGIVQASSGSMTVEISIYTAGGSLLASQQRTLTTGWDQFNDVFDKLGVGAATIEGGWIKVRLVSGSPDAWTCYASVVDKGTSDPTYVAGVEVE
jgi:hypothetical protein